MRTSTILLVVACFAVGFSLVTGCSQFRESVKDTESYEFLAKLDKELDNEENPVQSLAFEPSTNKVTLTHKDGTESVLVMPGPTSEESEVRYTGEKAIKEVMRSLQKEQSWKTTGIKIAEGIAYALAAAFLPTGYVAFRKWVEANTSIKMVEAITDGVEDQSKLQNLVELKKSIKSRASHMGVDKELDKKLKEKGYKS